MTDELPPELDFKAQLAKLRAEKGKPVEPEPQARPILTPSNEFAEFVPDVYERTESDQMIEQTIQSIGILEAYRKWIGKEVNERETNLREGCHVSCPQPSHRDSNPSAYINQDKNLYHCMECDMGGDIYDLATIAFGYSDRPTGAEFHRLREKMAESFGTHITKTPAGNILAWRDDNKFQPPAPQQVPVTTPPVEVQAAPAVVTPEPVAPPVASFFAQQTVQPAPSPPVATVTPLHAVPVAGFSDEDIDKEIQYAQIDWRNIVKPDTFLYEYMTAACTDDSPEEYHFWHAMMALGHAAGRRIQLADRKKVKGNLLVCLLGGTGAGKSKSLSYLTDLLEDVFPFKDDGDRTTGVKDIGSVASGEALIKAFDHLVVDPSTMKPTGAHAAVNGIADWSEFSGLLGRANRHGSTLKSIIIEFADCAKPVRSMSIQNGQLSATDHFCSIISTTQPLAIRTLVEKSDESSGFLNRWVFAGGPEKEKEVFGGQAYGGTYVDMSRATDRLKSIKGWAAREREITVSQQDGAYDAIVQYFHDEIFPVKKKDDMLARLDLFYKKILLLFAINEQSDVVTIDMHERAKKLIPYLIQCYGLVSEQIGITTSHEIVADIIHHTERHMAKHGKGVTVRDLLKMMWRKNYTPDQVNKAIQSMCTAYLLEEEPRTTNLGRPAVRYRKIEA